MDEQKLIAGKMYLSLPIVSKNPTEWMAKASYGQPNTFLLRMIETPKSQKIINLPLQKKLIIKFSIFEKTTYCWHFLNIILGRDMQI